MGLVWHGLKDVMEELPCGAPTDLFREMGNGGLAGAVNADNELQPAFSGLHFGNVVVTEPDRVAIELADAQTCPRRYQYCRSDGLRGRGAPVTNLASFHPRKWITPSNRGISRLQTIQKQIDLTFRIEKIRADTNGAVTHRQLHPGLRHTAKDGIVCRTVFRTEHDNCGAFLDSIDR